MRVGPGTIFKVEIIFTRLVISLILYIMMKIPIKFTGKSCLAIGLALTLEVILSCVKTIKILNTLFFYKEKCMSMGQPNRLKGLSSPTQ